MDHKLARPSRKSRAVSPDPRVARSRRALHAALLELVSEGAFEHVTAAAIAARAGIGYATFFRHYADPEAVLAEIADGLIGELIALVAPLVLAQDTRAAAAALTEFVAARRPLCRALLVGAGETMRRDITTRAIAATGTAGTALPSWLPPDLSIVHGVAATLTILRWWLEQEAPPAEATVAEMIDRLVFVPIVAPNGF